MASRVSLLKEDFSSVKGKCDTINKCPFQDFELDDDFCHFVFKDGIVEKDYKIHFSDDYPNSSLLTVTEKSRGVAQKTDSRQCSERLPVLLNRIAKDMCIKLVVTVPGETNNNTSPMEADALSDGVGSEDDDSDDYGDYYNSADESNAHVYEMNPVLEDDLERMEQNFTEDVVKVTLFDTIDGIDVEFFVHLDFLDTEVAKAWKLVKEEPLIIRLNFSLSRYLDGSKPAVKVYQTSQNKFGIGSQLEKILEMFLSDNWKDLSNDRVKRESKPVKKNPHRTQESSASSDEDEPQMAACAAAQPEVNDKHLAELISMGFEVNMARNALIIARNQIEEAVTLLVNDPAKCQSISAAGHVSQACSSSSAMSLPPPPVLHEAIQSASSHEASTSKQPALKKYPMKRSKGRKAGAKQSAHSEGKGSKLHSFLSSLLPAALSTVIDPKDIPSLQDGFLVQLMTYIKQRVPRLNDFCVICDKPHMFQNGAMLKPAVCGGQLCVFSFQTLGVMSDAAEDIATGAEVVDLLIAMAKAACKSSRRDTIFEPYPTVIDPDQPTELALNPNAKAYDKCSKVLDHFIDTYEMSKLDAAAIKKRFDEKNKLAYPLLQWIINSNRSHIVKLPKEKQFSFMKTTHQYLLMSSAPAKEAAFRQAKAKHGSIFAFHGSHLENWHSIMRVGLINASGTKYQMHGAAHGKGIYLSPKARVSFGYCGSMGLYHGRPGKGRGAPPMAGAEKSVGGKAHRNFLNASRNLTCIALCEVVNSADLGKSSDIWVMKNDEHVCTRFFFVYESNIDILEDIDSTMTSFKKEIEKAMSFCYH